MLCPYEETATAESRITALGGGSRGSRSRRGASLGILGGGRSGARFVGGARRGRRRGRARGGRVHRRDGGRGVASSVRARSLPCCLRGYSARGWCSPRIGAECSASRCEEHSRASPVGKRREPFEAQGKQAPALHRRLVSARCRV